MDRQRRIFLGRTVAASTVMMAMAAGLLAPARVIAAWPEKAFSQKTVDTAIQTLFGNKAYENSKDISLKTPDIAENGAVVPVKVRTTIPGAESISVIAYENVRPLAITADFAGNARPALSTRIKLGKTSKILALVKANGKVYGASRTVKVTIGGCGG
jgi:sulfur-oxidizing protein SoxY